MENKEALVKLMTEIECYPLMEEKAPIKEYTKISIGEMSSLGAVFASISPVLKGLAQSGTGEQLYRMKIPRGLRAGERVIVDKTGGILGNIVDKKGITKRARFYKVENAGVGAVLKINPAIMMIAIAITAITRKLDKIEEAQKDIIEFLQLKEKASLKGNVAVLQEILEEYKFNWDNEKYKNNKHIQVQEIKRDAEKSIIFCREQIEKRINKKGFLHSDKDVKSKISKVQYEFKDYELAMYIFSFSSFLEVMLLENFEAGYLNIVTERIGSYADQYRQLYEKCYEMIEGESKTSIQAYALKGVAGINKALGKTIAKIPKISDGQVDEKLIDQSEKIQSLNEKRVESTMELFVRERCTCVQPFVDNINLVNQVYNEPMDLLFDDENVYFKLAELPIDSL